jgi:hypothetical protein
MNDRDYLLSFGKSGDFGRFQADEPLACRRGDRLVVRSHRGLELAVVLRSARGDAGLLLGERHVGRILRRATSGDEQTAQQMEQRGQQLYADARRLAVDLRLGLEILDAEMLLDGSQAVVHYLRWAECDPRPLMDRLAAQYRLLVTLQDLRTPAAQPHQEEYGSCGAENCGGGGGCGSCQAGSCATCTSRKPPPPAASIAAVPEGRVSLV